MDFTLQKSKIDALKHKILRIVKFSNKFIRTIYSEIYLPPVWGYLPSVELFGRLLYIKFSGSYW